MAYQIEAGLQISLDGSTWYKLTDHNRQEIQANPTLIEKQSRMANGTMRKYVIAAKMTISTSWEYIPSLASLTVDGNYSSGWMNAFYDANVFVPVWVKLVNAKVTTPSTGSIPSDATHLSSKLGGQDVIQCYITNFSTTTVHRTPTCDFVNMEIEFTEI